MKLHRRTFLHLAAGAVALPMVSRIATGQAYPSRPVRIVAGFPPGGVNDLHARLFGQWLSERLHQQFVVENRPGAGGSLAADSVARSQPDGYTLLLTSASDSWNTALYDNLKFDYLRDLVPVASLTRFTGVLVVHPSHPAQTVPELIAGIKRNPGKVSMATAGVGSASHIYWELFKSITGVDMVHVPYRGEGPALVDLIAGQIPMMIPSLPPSIEYIKAGRLRPLAVTVASRDEALSEIPTMNSFLPAYEASAWVGIAAPRNTPEQIISTLNRETNAGLANARIRARLAELGATPIPASSAEFAQLIGQFTDRWAGFIRGANIKAE